MLQPAGEATGTGVEVDDFHERPSHAASNARQWVADLERKERERSGIATLRVGYNKVFGYYLEISNSQLARVPSDYIRKQTLSTGERYITPSLKEKEAEILQALDRQRSGLPLVHWPPTPRLMPTLAPMACVS